jgi:sugar phosphate isomerase/epimerase
MKGPLIGASTFCLLFQPWRTAVTALLDLGFQAVELFGDAPQAHFTQLDAGDRRALREAAMRCELSLHAPGYELNVASANPCNQEEAVRQYREAVYLAAEIGARRLVVHEGHMSYWKLDRREARKAALAGLNEVLKLARQMGIVIGLENTNYGKFAMYDSWQEWAAMASELAAADDPALQLVLDVGHARLAGWDIPGLLRTLAPRIGQLHVHDNTGASDDHLHPGQGVVGWREVGRALLETGCEATIILESGPFEAADAVKPAKTWLDAWLAPHRSQSGATEVVASR